MVEPIDIETATPDQLRDLLTQAVVENSMIADALDNLFTEVAKNYARGEPIFPAAMKEARKVLVRIRP